MQNDEFLTLQYNEMQKVLERQGIHTTKQTLSKYYNHLKEINWLYDSNSDFVYYIYDSDKKANKYISKEEYNLIYKEYWNIYNTVGTFAAADEIII